MAGGTSDRRQLELAIAAQEGLRGVVPDEVVDAAVAALREQLEGTRPETERRRQVTVLFADVSGFTKMSSRLDPELIADVMNALWTRLDAVIASYGGRVDKHIGDAVMAVWGTTSTEEDDPERAVRAGLAMQEELGRRTTDDGLAMRVGINTGAAHLGAVGSGSEFTAMGDAVNVASRVEGAAPAGGVVVTHDTYRHIRGIFEVEALPPAVVKGKDDPLQLYLVRGVRDRQARVSTRGVEGVDTRLIGRGGELATLRDEFARVVARSEVRRVTVVGDAGVGKSRLLVELEQWIEVQPVGAEVLKGRAIATRHAAALGLLRDLVADRFGVLDSEPASAVADKLRAGLAPALTADEADVVGHWLGFDLRASPAVQGLLGSGQLAMTARAQFRRYIELLAADAPVVLLLEDLHWADDESLAVIDELAADHVAAHLLIVGVGRPTVLERPGLGDLLERSSAAVVLAPLDDGATRELVHELLQHADSVPDELTDLIIERADGNAFYVEELLKMLMEDGVIEVGGPGGRWEVHIDRLRAVRVPATLTGVLQTRLDSLSGEERDALQRAAVIGRVFWDGAVQSLGSPDPSTLERARRRELVYRHLQSAFDDAVEYAFKHALLRDVTYETVLLRDRERLHALVAQWMSEHAGDRASEHSSQIALHLRLAGDVAAAAEMLGRAGIAALEAGNSPAARRHLEDALSLWETSAEDPPADALLALTEACVRLGAIDVAQGHCAATLARPLTAEQRVGAAYLESWIASERGDIERERRALDTAFPDAERLGGVLLYRMILGLCWWEVRFGHTATAQALVERADVIAHELDRAMEKREVLGLRGIIAERDGDLERSIAFSSEALALTVASGDLEGQALANANIGVGYHLLGDASGSAEPYLAALDHYRRATALNQRLGRHLQIGMTSANMAQIQTRLGDLAAARVLAHEGLVAVRRSGGNATLLFCVLADADRRLVSGDVRRGLELMGTMRAHPAWTNDNDNELGRILGRVDLPQDVVDEGMAAGAQRDFDTVVDELIAELGESEG